MVNKHVYKTAVHISGLAQVNSKLTPRTPTFHICQTLLTNLGVIKLFLYPRNAFKFLSSFWVL